MIKWNWENVIPIPITYLHVLLEHNVSFTNLLLLYRYTIIIILLLS